MTNERLDEIENQVDLFLEGNNCDVLSISNKLYELIAELRALQSQLPKPGSLVLEPITMDNLPKVGEDYLCRGTSGATFGVYRWMGNRQAQIRCVKESRAWRLPEVK